MQSRQIFSLPVSFESSIGTKREAHKWKALPFNTAMSKQKTEYVQMHRLLILIADACYQLCNYSTHMHIS